MISLFIRNLIFTILQPGIVAGLVPYLVLRYVGGDVSRSWTISSWVGLILMILGVAVALSCIWRFVRDGEGTISPLDPTRKLIVSGLYRFSRNPMYVGVTTLLVGETIFFWSPAMVIYASIIFVAFNLVIQKEESRLMKTFDLQFDDYRRSVRRWL